MCTVIILRGLCSDWPVILAANRDEFYARPTRPPEILGRSPRIVGGVDIQAGGTWMGLRDSGLVVGVTNQRGAGPAADKLSRGQLVLDAIRLGTLDAIAAHLRDLDARRYSSFNLFAATGERVLVGYGRSDSEAVELEEVGQGVHILPNDRLDSPASSKVGRALELLCERTSPDFAQLAPRLAEVLADHHLPAPSPVEEHLPFPAQIRALCVHTPVYGTRSASIIGLAPNRLPRYLHADGPPCSSAFEDLGGLLT